MELESVQDSGLEKYQNTHRMHLKLKSFSPAWDSEAVELEPNPVTRARTARPGGHRRRLVPVTAIEWTPPGGGAGGRHDCTEGAARHFHQAVTI